MQTCPVCHLPIAIAGRFCVGCGAPLPAPICPACERPVAHLHKFCDHCGASFDAGAPTSRSETKNASDGAIIEDVHRAGGRSCFNCGSEAAALPRKTLLGFQEWTCADCHTVNRLPLTSARRNVYQVFATIMVLGSIVWVSEGRVPLPGLLGIAVIVALTRDAQLRRRASVKTLTAGVVPPPRVPHRTRLIGVAGALCVAVAVMFPPWRAQATRTTFTYRQYVGTDSVVDRFQWTIPFAPIFDPPSDPSLLEGILAEGIASAQTDPPGVLDSAIDVYLQERGRAEARARIPYHLTQEALRAPSPEGEYVVRRASFVFEVDFPRLALALVAIGAVTVGAIVMVRRV